MDDASLAEQAIARERNAFERAACAERRARQAREEGRHATSPEVELRHELQARMYERAAALHLRAAALQAEHYRVHASRAWPQARASIIW